MKCPACGSADDKVIDSRAVDDGIVIRRRRECLLCGRRFTTFERLEEAPLVVVKRSGEREPFDRAKVVGGVQSASKNRPIGPDEMEALAVDVEESMRLEGPEVSTQQVGKAVLDRLRILDDVAYVRFASVYKGFEELGDFEREVALTKATEPKRR